MPLLPEVLSLLPELSKVFRKLFEAGDVNGGKMLLLWLPEMGT